jgi:geranylgeranyl diphosphate synthase, type II
LTMKTFNSFLKSSSRLVNDNLTKYLPADNSLISRAMRYSVNAGGKRLRPILTMEAASICGIDPRSVMPAACAIEFVHTYSLIHDDLPAMDNDDLRRGKPTSHRKFDEATAILAGDALLTEAFGLFTRLRKAPGIKPENILRAIDLLSDAAGYRGMILGQIKDTVEAKGWNKKNEDALKKELYAIHLNKTAKMIEASLLIGGVLAGAGARDLDAFSEYGRSIGIAFQIVDDVLDIVGDKKLLGKRGSDRDNNKLTYPALYRVNESLKMAAALVAKAKNAAGRFGKKAEKLEQLADFIVKRKH